MAPAKGRYSQVQTGSVTTSENRAGRMSPGAGIDISSRVAEVRARKTRRIGCAKLLPEYWVIGLGSGKPQSQAGPRRIACEAKRWMVHTASIADMAINRNTSRPL